MRDSLKQKTGLIQFAIVVIVVVFTFFLSNSLKPELTSQSSGKARTGKELPHVAVVAAEPLSYTPSVKLTGTVIAGTETDLAAQVKGKVTFVSEKLRAGAAFKKGDLLFTLDSADFDLAVGRAKAEMTAAKSELQFQQAKAEIALQDWQKTFPGKDIPPLAAREPQLKAAEARVKAAETSWKEAELALSRTKITAPFDGRVIATKLDVGQVVVANQATAKLYDLKRVEIEVPLSVRDMDHLTPIIGRRAQFDGGIGKVVRVGAVLDPRTRLGKLYIQPSDPSRLITGRFTTVTIQADPVTDAVKLPVSAVSMGQVWTVQNGALAQQTVDILGYEGETVILRSFAGYTAVVTALPPRAEEGQKVIPRPTATQNKQGA